MPSLDPTKTATLRRTYAQKMNGKFLTLSTDARAKIRELSATDLSNREKAFQFEEFLDVYLRDNLVENRRRRLGARDIDAHWQSKYVRAAYQRAVDDTQNFLSGKGLLSDESRNILRGTHGQAVRQLEHLVFDDLQNITDDLKVELPGLYRRLLDEGRTQAYINKRMRKEILKASNTRGIVLARTQTIKAYNDAILNTLAQNRIREVEVDVEFTTAFDPCPICAALSGRRYTISQARGVIPQHPRCRCRWLPVAESRRMADAA